MVRQSACEHDIVNYGVVGGSGLDVVEQCGVCGERITHDSPKTIADKEAKKSRRRSKR